METIVTVIPTQTRAAFSTQGHLPAGQDHTLPEKTRDGPLVSFYFV